ncbi:hypothetical protein V7024_18315, partial [Bacillus sp. JJ864]|uniref:hypothetical protein n=1 Tax=Bacillus sp. JJ864 TaxID=3122975 RepID=UPI002FFF2C56
MVCLKDYQRLEEEIAYLEYKLEKTKAELKRWNSGEVFKYKLTADPEDSVEIENRIEHVKRKLVAKQEQINKLIDTIGKFKGLENKILKMKYIDGMKLERIAEELKYSSSYIKLKHAEIMRRFKFAERLKSGG